MKIQPPIWATGDSVLVAVAVLTRNGFKGEPLQALDEATELMQEAHGARVLD
jgi:hypothetical protein